MFVTFAYVEEGGARELEANTPFLWTAHYHKARGWRPEIVAFVLKGYERLSSSYLDALRECGFLIINAEAEHTRNLEQLNPPDDYNHYELNNFGRWLILQRFIEREQIRETVVHIDGDVVFNVPPAQVYAEMRGKTFVLQGCPAFTVLSDVQWFDQYNAELVRFFANPQSYEKMTWEQPGNRWESVRTRWAGAWSQNVFSDQSLISYLIHIDRLVQDRPAQFLDELKFFYVQNPLYLHVYTEQQLGQKEIAVTARSQQIVFHNKPIAFWHMQNDFTEFVRLAWLLDRVCYPSRYPNSVEAPPRVRNFLRRGKRFILPNRRAVYRMIREFDYGDSRQPQIALQKIFTAKHFWAKGHFL